MLNENSVLLLFEKKDIATQSMLQCICKRINKVRVLSMSVTKCTLKLLNMKDKNLKFSENYLEERIINNKRCLIIKGYLENNFEFCPSCGCISNFKKNGTRTSLIKIPKISELDSYLELTKQIYKCRECNSKITAQTEEIEYRCRISNNTKHSIINYAKETITHKFIASMHNVSNKTVQRQINKVYDNEKLYKHSLSENLCFDEFTYKKGVMAFNFCDADTGKTIDLVEDRTTENLNKYFGYYSFESRSRVKNIVIDMYKPYITVIKVNFPNASIIIDPFHITQLISKSMNKTRIKIMKKSKEHYRKFKRYWRLFLKSRLDLDSSCWRKYRCFKNLMTEVDVVDFLLNLDDELKATYNLYQNILYSLQHKDYELFKTIIEQSYNNISSLMQTSLNTLREFSPYIKNTLSTKYSNGIMERNNNTCKLVKRIGFGFRNFRNFKARIMIITNLFRTNKRSTEFSLSTP